MKKDHFDGIVDDLNKRLANNQTTPKDIDAIVEKCAITLNRLEYDDAGRGLDSEVSPFDLQMATIKSAITEALALQGKPTTPDGETLSRAATILFNAALDKIAQLEQEKRELENRPVPIAVLNQICDMNERIDALLAAGKPTK